MIRHTRKYRTFWPASLLVVSVVSVFPALAQNDVLVGPNNDMILKNRDLVMQDSTSQERFRIDAQTGNWNARDDNGNSIALMEVFGRNILLGGSGRAGDLVLFPRTANDQNLENASVHLDGSNGTQTLGGATADGRLILKDARGRQRIQLHGGTADLVLGQEGSDGDVIVRNQVGKQTVGLDGATGQIDASGQVRSSKSGSGSDGLDSATFFAQSANPSIALHDTSNGNSRGWYIQSGSAGQLVFSAATTDAVGATFFTLQPDGAICLGAC